MPRTVITVAAILAVTLASAARADADDCAPRKECVYIRVTGMG